jgi:hypothetical protein
MLAVFLNCEGIIHHEFLPRGQTVNKEYYLKVMKVLREAVRRKRPGMLRGKKWLLHHDNAPVHFSLLIHDFITKHETTLIPKPPYTPDLALADLFLITYLKSLLKGRRFELVEEIKKKSLQSYAVFYKRHSRNASKTGRNAESNVQKVEEGTLKGTKPSSSKVSEKMIYINCSESLWIDLV